MSHNLNKIPDKYQLNLKEKSKSKTYLMNSSNYKFILISIEFNIENKFTCLKRSHNEWCIILNVIYFK